MPQRIICCKNSGIVPLPFACLPTASSLCPRVCHSIEPGQGCVLYCSATPTAQPGILLAYTWDMPFQEKTPCLGVGLQWSMWVPSNSGYSTVLWGRGRERGEKYTILKALYQLYCIRTQAWNIFMWKASHRKRELTTRRVTWAMSHTNHQDGILTVLNTVHWDTVPVLQSWWHTQNIPAPLNPATEWK